MSSSVKDSSGAAFALSLREIASRHHIPGIGESSEVKASVPVLQRGLVWDPAQIELLWDSLLRGFPIGALVLSSKIPNQDKAEDAFLLKLIQDEEVDALVIACDIFNSSDPFPK